MDVVLDDSSRFVVVWAKCIKIGAVIRDEPSTGVWHEATFCAREGFKDSCCSRSFPNGLVAWNPYLSAEDTFNDDQSKFAKIAAVADELRGEVEAQSQVPICRNTYHPVGVVWKNAQFADLGPFCSYYLLFPRPHMSLYQYLTSEEADPTQTELFLQETLCGIKFWADHFLTHGNLRPDNILLCGTKNGRLTAKVGYPVTGPCVGQWPYVRKLGHRIVLLDAPATAQWLISWQTDMWAFGCVCLVARDILLRGRRSTVYDSLEHLFVRYGSTVRQTQITSFLDAVFISSGGSAAKALADLPLLSEQWIRQCLSVDPVVRPPPSMPFSDGVAFRPLQEVALEEIHAAPSRPHGWVNLGLSLTNSSDSVVVNGAVYSQKQCFVAAARLGSSRVHYLHNLARTMDYDEQVFVEPRTYTLSALYAVLGRSSISPVTYMCLGMHLESLRADSDDYFRSAIECYIIALRAGYANVEVYARLAALMKETDVVKINNSVAVTRKDLYIYAAHLEPTIPDIVQMIAQRMADDEEVTIHKKTYTKFECFLRCCELGSKTTETWHGLGVMTLAHSLSSVVINGAHVNPKEAFLTSARFGSLDPFVWFNIALLMADNEIVDVSGITFTKQEMHLAAARCAMKPACGRLWDCLWVFLPCLPSLPSGEKPLLRSRFLGPLRIIADDRVKKAWVNLSQPAI
jgi:hypothetical protein